MITIKNLTKKFGVLTALDSINLEIKSGSIFGFIGPNGAGKSTTLNILTFLEKQTSGDIRIGGINPQKQQIEIKNYIGVLPEKLPLFDGLTGAEFLHFICKIYGFTNNEIKLRIDELFYYLDFENAKHRFVETYSQGMRKKISFSAAIIHNPKYLFLDEPFENVDPISRKKMKEILRKMKNNGSTIFITSHALIEVEDFCDEVAIINKGKIVYQSATKDIRKKIKNVLTQETYQSLEEIFIDLTTDNRKKDNLPSWL